MRKSLLILATLSAACGSAHATGPQMESSGTANMPTTASKAGSPTLQKVNHFVVIVLENWSFDSLYAEFQGAEGLTNALGAPPQVDPTTGQPYATLPQTETHMPMGLADTPFALDPYLTVTEDTSIDLTTNFYS
jgi:phospholipase C